MARQPFVLPPFNNLSNAITALDSRTALQQIVRTCLKLGMVRIRRELIPGIRHVPGCRSIPDRIVREALRIQQQRMAR